MPLSVLNITLTSCLVLGPGLGWRARGRVPRHLASDGGLRGLASWSAELRTGSWGEGLPCHWPGGAVEGMQAGAGLRGGP